MAGLGFERAEAAETGRPGYDPRDLLKLYLYGYLQQIRSSRRLELHIGQPGTTTPLPPCATDGGLSTKWLKSCRWISCCSARSETDFAR
jgi:hypothetical protein